jgi:HK97 family phage major capsid protein
MLIFCYQINQPIVLGGTTMTLRELLQKRAALTTEMRSIVDKPTGEGGDLAAEQETRFGTLKTELASVEKQIERQQFIDDAERRSAATPIGSTGDNRLDTALGEYSFRRAILSQIPGHQIDCRREVEVGQEIARRSGRNFEGIAVPTQILRQPIEQRVTTTGSPAEGSNLIQTDLLAGQFIDLLRAALVTRQLGCRVLGNLVGNIDIPKQIGATTSGWVAENSALDDSDAEFASVSLSPRHVGAVSEISRNMLMQSSLDVEQLMRADQAAVVARAIDLGALNGTGGVEPTGVLTAVEPTAGGTPTWAKILELIEAVELGNVPLGGAGWLLHPSTRRLLRSTEVVNGFPQMIMQDPNTLAGYPAVASTIVPAGASGPEYPLVYGQWSDLIMGYWSELDVLVNPYETTAYSKGNVKIRTMATCDVALRHVESFAYYGDLETS